MAMVRYFNKDTTPKAATIAAFIFCEAYSTRTRINLCANSSHLHSRSFFEWSSEACLKSLVAVIYR